jgi:hypothetical protein
MKTLLLAAVLLFSIAPEKNKLTGKWAAPSSPMGTMTVEFKEDGSFETLRDGYPHVTGDYELKDSVLTVSDAGCNFIAGKYKPRFFSNSDSVRFELVEDDCFSRAQQVSSIVLGRVKERL